MLKDECEFLYGAKLSACIRKICDAPNVDCAVAFWGVGIKAHLFTQWGNGKIRIVCNISMGATCRAALAELGAPSNENLRVHDSLHGKVYLSAHGALIGSPNASDNGVGIISGASGSLLESGVFCPAGSKAYGDAVQWFEGLFDAASIVDQAELAGAPERSRELRPRGSRAMLSGLTLLRRLRDFPDNFLDVHVAIATGRLDKNRAEATRNERAKARGRAANPLPDDVVIQNDEGWELQSFSGPLLLLWRARTVTWVQAYTDCSTWPPSNPDTVFGIDNWEGFWKAINLEPSEGKLSAEESKQIEPLFDATGGRWVFTASEFAARLADLRSTTGPR